MPDKTEEEMRDWFAGQALIGLIKEGFNEFGNAQHAYAQMAYEFADAMMEARSTNAKED